MLENIRQIGLFMIAAQAVIHFAPGRQYEKYIKFVSSVIILLLFLKPFLSGQEALQGKWQTGMEQIIQQYEKENLWQGTDQSADEAAVAQLEEQVRARLNEAVSKEAYVVNSVSFVFEKGADRVEGAGYERQFQKVAVEMKKQAEEGIEPVLVEEIVIGQQKKEDTQEGLQYQEIFAGMLGIEPDRVEVTCVGGW